MKRLYPILVFWALCLMESLAAELLLNERQQVLMRFPSVIRYADFGNGSIDGQVLHSDRILRVRGRSKNFGPTNLSVVTADGKYYEFHVHYGVRLPYIFWDAEHGPAVADTLEVNSETTTHFILEEPLSEYVLGSDSIIAMRAGKIDNMVKLKSTERFTALSSVALIGDSDSVYSFVLRYNDGCQTLTKYLGSGTAKVLFNERELNEYEFQKYAKDALSQHPFMSNYGVVAHKMEFSLTGIYSCQDMLFFCVHLRNASQIDYAVDFVKMYIRDVRKSKRIAAQEEELHPLSIYCTDEAKRAVLPGNSELSLVYCFRRFTLPAKRGLFLELFERNGGRHLRFSVSSKALLKTKKLY